MRRPEAWHRYGLGALAVTVAFVLLGGHPPAQALVFIGLQAAITVAVAVAVRRHSPDRRRPWALLLAAEGVYLVANLWWFLYPTGFDGASSYPSPVEPLFWAAYLGWAAFLAILIRRQGGAGGGASVDAVVISGGLAVLGREFLLEPAVEVPGMAAAASSCETSPKETTSPW